MKKLKVIIFGSLFWLSFVMLVLGGIGGLGLAFSGEPGELLEFVVGLSFWGGLTYLFYRIYKKAPESENSVANEAFDIEDDLDWGDDDYQGDDLVYVDGSPIYRFDYVDAKGEFSQRRAVVNSIERRKGLLYINAMDLDKHASRKFRVDSIHSLIIEDTGELVKGDVGAHFSGVFD